MCSFIRGEYNSPLFKISNILHLYRQICMLNDMNKIENVAKWSKERLDAELEKGYNDMLSGRVTPWNDIYAELSKAISEIKNGALGSDAEEYIKGLMN